ncbi:MAG: amidohydrolase family protein [Gammaproteobacteria bacterium]
MIDAFRDRRESLAPMRHFRFAAIGIFASALCAVAAAQQPAQLVIANVRVFTGERSIERATITVADGRILRIAAASPANTSVAIDGAGKTALPGLIDSHLHILAGTAGTTEAEVLAFIIKDKLQDRMRSFLRNGVTTVKSTGDPTEVILKVRRDLREGRLDGPRLLVAGPVFTAPGGHPFQFCQGNAWCRSELVIEVDSEQDARRQVRRLAEAGVDAIKIVYQGSIEWRGAVLPKLRPDVMKAIIAEGRALGLPVTAHVGDELAALEALAAGASGLEHVPVPLGSDAVAQALKTPERSLVPTLAVLAAYNPQNLEIRSQTVAALYKAGVRIVVGTDTNRSMPPGESTVREVELLVKAGLSPEAALKAATSVAARHLGLEKEIGTLGAGMAADILLVRGNPLENIADLRQVDAVVQGGKVVFRASR